MESTHTNNEHKLELIQRAVTRWVPELKNQSYEKSLKKLNLPTLKRLARRTRGTFITLYGCTTGMMETDLQNFIPSAENKKAGTTKIQQKIGYKVVRI